MSGRANGRARWLDSAAGGVITLALCGSAWAGASNAASTLPSGGQVKAGAANIAAGNGVTAINQSSPKAIIDWSSFSIGTGGQVLFNNGSGATLNRVVGGVGSAIDGQLFSSGSVYLINPNGVIIGKGGVVKVGGSFTASTLDVSDAAFMAGGALTLAGSSTASVVNLGRIGALGGDVVLAASMVDNQGAIDAHQGDVGLLAGTSVVLRDLTLDDGRFAVTLGGAGTSATNSGAITAAMAELRANGGDVYALAGNPGGVIRATGVSAKDGKVFLVAEGGTATAQSEIDATQAGGTGGLVETSGAKVDFAGATVKAGGWLIDTVDLHIDSAAADTLDINLVNTNVTLKTTPTGASGPGTQVSGAGDIDIDSPMLWFSAKTLTLDAYHSVIFNNAMTVAGPGGVRIVTNDGGTGGDLVFTYLGYPSSNFSSLQFTAAEGSGQSLTINGKSYRLLYTLDDIATTALGLSTSNYALAQSIDATGVVSKAYVSATLAGTFEGLGNTISNLTLDGNFVANGLYSQINVGLFGVITGTGTVRDLGLVGGSSLGFVQVGMLAGTSNGLIFNTYATGTAAGWGTIGGLVGWNAGEIDNSYATGLATVSDSVIPFGAPGPQPDVIGTGGGLVGLNDGTIRNSYATGGVGGGNGWDLGGLVGSSDGVIAGSYATGSLTSVGEDIGGLVGGAGGTITDSYATGAVTGVGEVGGLVGFSGGVISHSHATGAVTGLPESVGLPGHPVDALVGGLVGTAQQGSITDSYATGAVSGSTDVGGLVGMGDQASIATSYAKGATNGQIYVGGLIGQSSGAISSDYATGTTSGVNFVGGLAGQNTGSILNAYASGLTTGLNYVGGLVGQNAQGTIARSYASGAVVGGSLVGGLVGDNPGGSVSTSYWDTETAGRATSAGGTGLTTAQLVAALPSGLSKTNWGRVAGQSFPYLHWQFPGSAPEVVAGRVYGAPGGGGLAGLAVDGLENGIGIGEVTTGANGYYQLLAPRGVNADLFTYLTGSLKGNALESGVTGSTSDMDIYVGILSARTRAATISALYSALSHATGSGYGADFLFDTNDYGLNYGYSLDISATGWNFTIDRAVNIGAGSFSLASAGGITLRAGVTVGGKVTFDSAGAITEGGGGSITTDLFTGRAHGPVSLNGSNAISTLGGFSNFGAGGFSLRNIAGLIVTGPVDAGAGDLTINQQTPGGLRIRASLKSGGTTTLASGGAISENGAGAITTPLLNVTAQTGINLGGPNAILAVGANHTNSGPDVIDGIHP